MADKNKEKQIDKLGGTKLGLSALTASLSLGGEDKHVVAGVASLALGIGKDIFSGIGRMIAEKKAAPLSANNIAPNTARGTNIPGTPAPQATSELTPETSKLVEAGAPEKVEQSEMTNAEAVRAFRARGGAAPGAPEKTPTVVEKAKELRVANPQLTPAQAIAQARTLVKPKGLLSNTVSSGVAQTSNNITNVNNVAAPEISSGGPQKTEVAPPENEILNILNKILSAFQADNDRMRKQRNASAEAALEADPTPDAKGGPEKNEKKSNGMNKLLMLGAIGGLLALAYAYRDEISKLLDPIKEMLGIKDPTADADKEDNDFDIADMLGVSALLGMLGISGVPGGKGAAGKPTGGMTPEQKKIYDAERKAGKGAAEAKKTAIEKTTKPGSPVKGGGKPKVEKGIIKKLIGKRIAGAAGKVLPGIGLAIGLYDMVSRVASGDYTGAAIAAGSGAAGLIPGIGTGVAIAGAAANIARDTYKDAYDVFPEQDEDGDVAEKYKEIFDTIIEALTGSKVPELTEEKKKNINAALEQYKTAYEQKADPKRRNKLAGDVRKVALAAGLDKDAIEKELAIARDAGLGNAPADSTLSTLTSNQTANAPAQTSVPAGQSSAAPAAAPSASGAAPAPVAAKGGGGSPSAGGGGGGGGGAAPAAAPESAKESGAPEASAPAPATPAPVSPTSGEDMTGSPAASPAGQENSGNEITQKTMEAETSRNSVTVLPPITSNESTNLSANEGKPPPRTTTMNVRMDDETFVKALESCKLAA